jgi:outer membrane biosynthesis protein TonB
MFTIDQDITAVRLREKNLLKVFFSMNNHEVATPEMMLEEARSYVMFCGEAGGKVSAYIGLHLLQTGRRLFYAHSSNPFPQGETGSVEDEALCFVEGLGALVDEIDIAELSAEKKSRWIDDQDIFSLEARPEKSPEAPSPQPVEAEAVKAELQATQPFPAAPEAAPQPQIPPVQPPQQTPQTEPTQPAPEPRYAPQAAATTPQAPPPRAEESTPELSASQPDVERGVEDDAQAAPSPAEVPETEVAPTSRPISKGTAPGGASVPAPERMRPKPAAPAAGLKVASYASSSADRQDIGRRTIKGDIGRPPKPLMKKGSEDDTGVVRRDREALARLLSSF